MCIANQDKGAIYTEKGKRQGGAFTPNSRLGVGEKWADKHSNNPPMSATTVPLGDGGADAARLSILSRRERMRQVLDET